MEPPNINHHHHHQRTSTEYSMSSNLVSSYFPISHKDARYEFNEPAFARIDRVTPKKSSPLHFRGPSASDLNDLVSYDKPKQSSPLGVKYQHLQYLRLDNSNENSSARPKSKRSERSLIQEERFYPQGDEEIDSRVQTSEENPRTSSRNPRDFPFVLKSVLLSLELERLSNVFADQWDELDEYMRIYEEKNMGMATMGMKFKDDKKQDKDKINKKALLNEIICRLENENGLLKGKLSTLQDQVQDCLQREKDHKQSEVKHLSFALIIDVIGLRLAISPRTKCCITKSE